MIRFKSYIQEKIELPAKTKTMGIDRTEMPQIDSKDVADFISFLKRQGVTATSTKTDPKKLKATQHQFHITKVQAMIDKIDSGSYDNKPILTSKDNYVMDGHHRWLAFSNLGMNIDTIKVDLPAKQLIDMMHDYPKSYTKKLYESFDCVLTEDGDVCGVITQSHMASFEKIVDRLFAKFNINFDFTRHFRERMSDGRNKPCIDIKELASMIQKIYKKTAAGTDVLSKHVDAEVVIKDMQSDLNMPVAIEYDRKNDELRVVSKTIMRKKNFRTPNPEVKV